MIYPVTMYSAECDNCKEAAFLGNGEFSAYHEEDQVREDLMNSEWFNGDTLKGHEGKHYCPGCWSYDDNDNLVLKPVNHL